MNIPNDNVWISLGFNNFIALYKGFLGALYVDYVIIFYDFIL